MKIKNLTCLGYSGDELDQTTWLSLKKMVGHCQLVPSETPMIKLTKTDGLLVKLGAKIDADMISQLPQLKYIGMLGTGYGGIDVKFASQKNITVTNIAGYATEAVAEFTMAALINNLRSLHQAHQAASKGVYSEVGFTGQEVKGKIFAVIGMGEIGTRVAQLAQAFGAKVKYWPRTRKSRVELKNIEYLELDELIAKADVISINLALNFKTKRFINSQILSKVKPGTVIINFSPMELLDLDMVESLLKEKKIVLMLDHADEMTKQDLEKISVYKNCIIYPPIGYVTKESAQRKQKIFLQNLKSFICGQSQNVVNE